MRKAELVFIPWPAIGHLVSAVQVAKLMVDLNPNLSITVLTAEPPYDVNVSTYVHSLTATTSTTSRIKFISLYKSDPDVSIVKFWGDLVQTLGPLVKEVVTNIVEQSNSVSNSPRLVGFFLDVFLTFLVDLANEFGVPSYAFSTAGAGSLGMHVFVQALHDEQKVEFSKLKDSDTEFKIPSYANPVSIKLFPAILLNPETFAFFRNMMKGIREVKGIMVNTFSELESHAVASLSKGQFQIPPIYPVGPVLNLEGSNKINQNYDTIMQWLDEQPRSSVLFLCFGSMGSFGADQVKEIAYALEQSGHRFLWSLRRPAEQVKDMNMMFNVNDHENVAEVLPEGFLDRTAELGKVIGWAPQLAILGHHATGGFMSHCGWNSTLESIWFGVPMAAWPLYAEQQLNAFTLVKELGLAVEIKMDYKMDDGEVEIIKAEKLERGIRCLMGHDTDVRRRMKEMSEQCRKALMDGGSSYTILCRFVNDIIDNMP